MSLAKAASRPYEKCLRMVTRMAESHLEKIDRIESRHQEKLRRMLRDFSDPSDPTGVRRASVAVAEQFGQDGLRVRHGEGTKQRMIDDIGSDGDGFRCGVQSRYVGMSRRSVSEYEQALENIREEIQARIDIESLKPNEGLVAVAFYANGYAENVRIDRLGSIGGNISFGPIANEEFFRIYTVPAGRYRWDRVLNSFTFSKYRYDYSDVNWDFEVQPGKLNIAGYFVFTNRLFYHSGFLQHRPGLVLRLIESRYPELVERFEIADSIAPNDQFIDYYLREKRSRAEADSND